MLISKIIASGAFGAESAALDVAIRLRIPHGGFAHEGSLLDDSRVTMRYKLWEQPFADDRELAMTNLDISNGILVFTRGAPNDLLGALIDAAVERKLPCLHTDFEQADPLQAAFKINLWATRHPIENLMATGSVDDPGIYRDVYDCLHRALMMGRESYPGKAAQGRERKPLPRTVDEAVQYLVDEMPLKDKVTIANMTAEEIAELNFGIGNYIRNQFQLWGENQDLLASCAKSALRDRVYPDEASAVIIALLALKLEKTHKLRAV